MKNVLVVLCVLAVLVSINGLTHPDKHDNYLKKYERLPTHIVKTGEQLTGIGVNGVILAPRKNNDPTYIFWLSNGKEEIANRCEWGDYRPPQREQGEQKNLHSSEEPIPAEVYNFGDLFLPNGWGNTKIHILNLVVRPDNTATLTYCVD